MATVISPIPIVVILTVVVVVRSSSALLLLLLSWKSWLRTVVHERCWKIEQKIEISADGVIAHDIFQKKKCKSKNKFSKSMKN